MISAAEIGESDRRETAEGHAVTLTDALRAAARHVEDHKATLAWEGSEAPSDEERARAAAAASALGHEIDSLAAASETSRIYPREFEAIRSELQRLGFTLAPEVAQAVADAFHAERLANAPSPRRSKAARTSASRL